MQQHLDPDVYIEPDYDDVENAIEMARTILEFVISKIDADTKSSGP